LGRPGRLLAWAALTSWTATSVPQTLLQLMNDIDSGDPDAVAQVAGWYGDPFQPFVIARSRIGAFQKYVFMAYLDNLIAWADQLYGQVDTIESINQATQLYVFTSGLLGQLPEQIPASQSPIEYDYQSIQGKLDAFSNFSEMLENEFPFAGPVPSDPQSQASGLLGLSKTLFFCIPQNQKLLQYRSTIAGRLYNIRHCLNIQGVPQQLALFQPPANPLLLIEAEAEGIDPGSVLADVNAPLPNYRFSYLIQRAAELASICQAFGRQLLDVLEKNDAEGLALLRATQETQILTQMTDMKQQQVNEAQANIAALATSRAVAVTRYSYYQLLLGAGTPAPPAFGASINLASIPNEPLQSTGGVQLIPEESAELSLSTKAALRHAAAGVLQVLASIEAAIPNVSIGVDSMPLGVGGNVSVSFGGSNLASETEAVVHGLETVANYLTYQAWSAGKMGGYLRRQQEWTLQNNLAAGEIMQIDQQTQAALLRVKIAQDDLSTHTQQVANAQKVQDYLTSKFTSQQLYGWMIGQVSSLYS
jgi:Tc toxin complex TcA C-terminal TcB-binding domain